MRAKITFSRGNWRVKILEYHFIGPNLGQLIDWVFSAKNPVREVREALQ